MAAPVVLAAPPASRLPLVSRLLPALLLRVTPATIVSKPEFWKVMDSSGTFWIFFSWPPDVTTALLERLSFGRK